MNSPDLLIRGGTVIDPAQGLNGIRDILIRDGLVAEIGSELPSDSAEVFDAGGLLVFPGLIDMHVHLREPGAEEAETINSGCRAAAKGGFTAVCAMPNTTPATDDAGRVKYILDRAANAMARVYPIGAITRGREGTQLVEMSEMAATGAVGFSDDGCSVADSRVMKNALRYAGMVGRLVLCHEEDSSLAKGGHMNESALSAELGLAGIPSAAEELMVLRDIALAEYTGTRVHITHISTRGTVSIIREAKARGVKVTCDVTPHHLALTEDALTGYDTRFKMNPPLRTREDVEAVHRGLADGTIDAIATDHAPHYIEKKELEFIYAAFGVTGLETALGVVHRELVATGTLTWDEAIRKLSAEPAQLLGIPGGTIQEGSVADVTIYDPESPWTVEPRAMVSKSKNTCFFGWELPGQVIATILGGTLQRSAEIV